MSSHADTIRAAEQASMAMQKERDALLAENQRLRDALELIAQGGRGYYADKIAREALAGDAE